MSLNIFAANDELSQPLNVHCAMGHATDAYTFIQCV